LKNNLTTSQIKSIFLSKNSNKEKIPEYLFDLSWFEFPAKYELFQSTDISNLNSKLKNEEGKYNLSEEVFKKDSYPLLFLQKLIKSKADDPQIQNIISNNVFLLKQTQINQIFSSIGLENIWFENLWKLASKKILNNKNINTIFAKIINIGTNFLKHELKFNEKQSAFLRFFQTQGFSLLLQLILKVNIQKKFISN